MPELDAHGVRLSYDQSGEGPPVVMVSGRGMPRSWWSDDHVRPYTGAGYSVLRFDNRGMPPSESPTQPFEMADLVADAAALLDGLGLRGCVLLGHSMGGCIAQELAHERPDLARAVVLVATLGRQPGWLDVFHAGMIELFESGADVPAELLLGTIFGQLYNPDQLADDRRVMPWLEELLAMPPWEDPGRVNQWRAYAGYRAELDGLARIVAPTLVISFERDLIMPPALGREVADAIPGARFVEIPDAGHWGMILDPAPIHRIVLDFLREQDARPHD